MILTDACLQLQHDIADIQYDSAWASLQGAQSKAAAPKLKLLASTTSATASTVSHTSQLRYRNLRTLSPARVIMYACPDMVCTPEDKVRPRSQSSVSLLYKSAQDSSTIFEVPGWNQYCAGISFTTAGF